MKLYYKYPKVGDPRPMWCPVDAVDWFFRITETKRLIRYEAWVVVTLGFPKSRLVAMAASGLVP